MLSQGSLRLPSKSYCQNQLHETAALRMTHNNIKEPPAIEISSSPISLRKSLAMGSGLTKSCHSLFNTSSIVPAFHDNRPDDYDDSTDMYASDNEQHTYRSDNHKHNDISDIRKCKSTSQNNKSKCRSKCSSVISKFIDVSVLRNYMTIFFFAESFLVFFGLFNFIVFNPAIVISRGMTKYHKAWLVSVAGIGDLIARIGTGFFADRNYIKRYKLKAIVSILCGINCLVYIFADSFPWMIAHCFMYGFTSGAYVCLLPVVMLDFVGLETLSKTLGMVILSQGLSGVVGQMTLGMCEIKVKVGGSLFFFFQLVYIS